MDEFTSANISEPLGYDRKYDLCISLEVGEHLPESSSDQYVDNLVGLADIVLFSAAIPYQGGTGHINEQPLSYWKDKFEKRGFIMFDIIRPEIWSNVDVSVWYRQNTVLFIKDIKREMVMDSDHRIVDVVHPETFESKVRNYLEFKKKFHNILDKKAMTPIRLMYHKIRYGSFK